MIELGTKVKFFATRSSGTDVPMLGTIIGYADEIRRLWPIEFANTHSEEEIYLILVQGEVCDWRYVATRNMILKEAQ